MNDGSKGYEDGHYYRMTKEEAQMSPMRYDPETQTLYESEGWRSWGCVTALLHYWVSSMTIAMMGILGLLLAMPYILLCTIIAFAIALMFGYI